jgi:hypothetical protein
MPKNFPKNSSTNLLKNVHAVAIAAAASAGLLVLSASPSSACYVTASPCTELQDQIPHQGARLYDVVPGGLTTHSLGPTAPHHGPRPAPAVTRSK